MIERRIAWWAQSFRVANAMAAWRLAPLASEVDVIKQGGNSPSASMLRTLIAFGIPRGHIDRNFGHRRHAYSSRWY
jgi:hypothetical protein